MHAILFDKLFKFHLMFAANHLKLYSPFEKQKRLDISCESSANRKTKPYFPANQGRYLSAAILIYHFKSNILTVLLVAWVVRRVVHPRRLFR